jgi:hypothetical protein
MNDCVILRLPLQFVNALIEDLEDRIQRFHLTLDYFEAGTVPDDGMIAETDDEQETLFQIEYHQAILKWIRAQM